MAQWPRRIIRGKLKGQVYESEKAYRKAYAQETGQTRYRSRRDLARHLGYTGYSERRRIRSQLSKRAKAPGEVPGLERMYLTLRKGSTPERVAALLFEDFDSMTTVDRISYARKQLTEGEALYVWRLLYGMIDKTYAH